MAVDWSLMGWTLHDNQAHSGSSPKRFIRKSPMIWVAYVALNRAFLSHSRFFYLDEKLSHIQKLISDFDNIFKNRRSMREANASLTYWLSFPNNEWIKR